MDINTITIKNEGVVVCKSDFYTVLDVINESVQYEFHKGLNDMTGEIDSGIFGISYLLSMYPKINKKVLSQPLCAKVNDRVMELKDLSPYTCYMDCSHPLFSSKKSVRKLILQGIKKTKKDETVESIREKFHLSQDRMDRKLSCVGNERFNAMAAIAYCQDVQVYCFPWFSGKRYLGFEKRLLALSDILTELNKIIILPHGDTHGWKSSC